MNRTFHGRPPGSLKIGLREASSGCGPGRPSGRPSGRLKNREKCGFREAKNREKSRPRTARGICPGGRILGAPRCSKGMLPVPFFPFRPFLAFPIQAPSCPAYHNLPLHPSGIHSGHHLTLPHPANSGAFSCPKGPTGIPREFFHSGIFFGLPV